MLSPSIDFRMQIRNRQHEMKRTLFLNCYIIYNIICGHIPILATKFIFTVMFSFYKIYLYICYFSWNKWFQYLLKEIERYI